MPRGYVRTALGQVHYQRMGRGEPLLLLAASGRSSRMFEGLMRLLSSRFDVCAPDTPGFGASDPLPEGTTIEDLAACMAELLDGLDVARTHLYGLHTGNKIATAFSVRWPERVRGLVLAGQSHSLIPDRELRNRTILDIVQAHFERTVPGPGAGLADWAATFQQLGVIWWDRALVAGGGTEGDRTVARDKALDELEATGTATLYRANFAYDLGTNLARLRVPTTVLEVATPAEDRTIGRQGPAVQRLIPGAALRTIEEPRGHTLTLEERASDLADILTEVLSLTS